MLRFAILSLLLLPVGISATQEARPPEVQAPQAASKPDPDSALALRGLLGEIAAALSAGDKKKAEQMAEDLMLKDAEPFFQRAFGNEEGERIAAAHERERARGAANFLSRLQFAREGNQTEFVVTRLQDLAAPAPGGRARLEEALLPALKKPVTFYRVEAVRPGEKGSRALDFFAYVDGGFRHFERLTLSALSTAPPFRIRIGGQVARQRLLSQPRPVYPDEAKARGIQGTVRLQVIIGRDGTVQKVTLREGPAELVDSAITAVSQWRYQPTLLNGVLVEVVTTVDIIYTLKHR